MRIELISTGDEVITGSIDDTNASFLSRELIDAGLQVNRRHTTGDSIEELMQLFEEVSQRDCVAIETGGMGPTNDDLTTEAIAKVAQVPLEFNEKWYESMAAWFEKRGRPMAQTNIKQAMLPQGSLMIDNPAGTACGFVLKVNKAIFIFLPGVPRELKAMWESSVKEMVLSFTKDTVPRTHLMRLFLMGIGESDLSERLSHIQMRPGITIGDRAIYPLIELKIIGHDASDSDMIAVLEEVMKQVAPYSVCRDSYTLLDILTQQNIELGAINAVDGLCRGWLLIHLQSIFSNFVTCTVLNTNEDQVDKSALAREFELIDHVPQSNQIMLLPYKLEASADETHPYAYQLNFNLEVKDNGRMRNIKAHYLIQFKENVYTAKGNYARNRDFLSQLCCAQIYKTLVREPLVVPTETKVSVLSLSDEYVD